jgi:hypothetical protein
MLYTIKQIADPVRLRSDIGVLGAGRRVFAVTILVTPPPVAGEIRRL